MYSTFIIETRARLVTDEMCFYLSFKQRKVSATSGWAGCMKWRSWRVLRYNIYNISTFYLVAEVSGGRMHRKIATRMKHVNNIKNLFEMVLTLWQAQCVCFTVPRSKSYELPLNLSLFFFLHFILSFPNISR